MATIHVKVRQVNSVLISKMSMIALSSSLAMLTSHRLLAVCVLLLPYPFSVSIELVQKSSSLSASCVQPLVI